MTKYNLPYPEAVFDLDFFTNHDPQPFITLAQELWPTGDTFRPTITHSFLTLLARKNILLRVYSQNIDGLEHLGMLCLLFPTLVSVRTSVCVYVFELFWCVAMIRHNVYLNSIFSSFSNFCIHFLVVAELHVDKLVECHGHFRTASCTRCGKQARDMEAVKLAIVEEGSVPLCEFCKIGYVKPDIVFFGEGLPDRFHRLMPGDLKSADCCLVLGTSLLVAPVSAIPELVPRGCKRVLLNRELVGSFQSPKQSQRRAQRSKLQYHDLVHLGDCDDSIRKLAHMLGWLEELEELHGNVAQPSTRRHG